jgi:hypothetical protein
LVGGLDSFGNGKGNSNRSDGGWWSAPTPPKPSGCSLSLKKPPNAVPALQDILPYLPGKTMPVCPVGGQYTLNAVNQPATCSIAGHVLPK